MTNVPSSQFKAPFDDGNPIGSLATNTYGGDFDEWKDPIPHLSGLDEIAIVDARVDEFRPDLGTKIGRAGDPAGLISDDRYRYRSKKFGAIR